MPTAPAPAPITLRCKQTGAVTVKRWHEKNKVWLQHRDGEGGAFDAKTVAQVIRRGVDLEKWFLENF